MKFYTSDQHFDHTNVLQFEDRPFSCVEEMNAALIENWNNTVKDKDEVCILGDFAFAKGDHVNQLLKCLHGKKSLILGLEYQSILQ
jgi:calcineurin-like phosphoesterase family protein